ncbi:MAG: Nramp family divalent metal transporter, partial [candidate division NC10 bacterium]|nr:Nramp family divalent metal transporter [candidate division NC10 bacterium]
MARENLQGKGTKGAGESMALGALDPLKLAVIPAFVGVFAYVGPGILWAALAQGSGELIWWPYLTAKYGAAFLGLLIPASLLQYWVNIEICRYVVATGENPLTGFTRMARWFTYTVMVGIIIENAWFGAYSAAGGTALASLTGFPVGWSPKGQSLFWGYATIGIYLFALVFGKVVYNIVEKVSMAVVVITMAGIGFAIFQPKVTAVTGAFWGSLLPHFSWPANWEGSDLKILVTSIAYAGAGGFGQLFIGYWIRDKGFGMGKHIGRVTSPITGEEEAIPATGFYFKDTEENRRNFMGWMKAVHFTNFVGVFLNTLTTIIMSWLAFALLLPTGKIPKGWEIAVVQSAFFEVAWGPIGKALFLIVAAAFLCDVWIQLTDGWSRVFADFLYANFETTRKKHFRFWYYVFVGVFTVLTTTTMLMGQPGQLIAMRGVVSFLAMGFYCPALIYLNYKF